MKEGLIHGIKFHRDCAIGEKLALERRSLCTPYIVEREGFGIYYNILVRAQVKLISIN